MNFILSFSFCFDWIDSSVAVDSSFFGPLMQPLWQHEYKNDLNQQILLFFFLKKKKRKEIAQSIDIRSIIMLYAERMGR